MGQAPAVPRQGNFSKPHRYEVTNVFSRSDALSTSAMTTPDLADSVARRVRRFFELLLAITWKSIAIRYKQSYLGTIWVVLKPLVMVLIFMLLRTFIGIDSGDLPYPLLAYCALLPWIYFQESASDGTGSVVAHSAIIRKIYVPRILFPIASACTKTVDLAVNFLILGLLMTWYGYGLQWTMLWVPLLIALAVLAALTVSLVGAAVNVYYRDASQIVPLILSLMMYASPIIYPLSVVREKLVEQRIAGDWSDLLFLLYTLNPLTGVIDGFQNVMLRGVAPDLATMAPGIVLLAVMLPLSYMFFKRAEGHFADFI